MRPSDLFNPYFTFSTIFDGVDLTLVHFISCLSGAIMAMYVMGLWSHGYVAMVGDDDQPVTRFIRRIALTMFSLATLWSLAYSTTKGWEPWPPDLFALIAVDLFLVSTILVDVSRRIRISRERRVLG